MWVELDSVRLRWSLAWCLIGDFNIIRYPVGRLGCDSFSSAMFISLTLLRKIIWLICLWRGAITLSFVIPIILPCPKLIGL